MDPVTLIVTALAAGAAAGLKDTAASAVKDAYAAVKGLLSRRYGGVKLDSLEGKPESGPKRDSLAEDLADAGAGDDEELLELAERLFAVVREHDEQAAEAIGVDVKDVEAEFIRVRNVRSTGTGVRIERAKVKGGLDVSDVDAGRGSGSENP